MDRAAFDAKAEHWGKDEANVRVAAGDAASIEDGAARQAHVETRARAHDRGQLEACAEPDSRGGNPGDTEIARRSDDRSDAKARGARRTRVVQALRAGDPAGSRRR